METKSKVLTYFFLLILLTVIFVTGWLWGKLNPRFLLDLPFTGTDNVASKPDAETAKLQTAIIDLSQKLDVMTEKDPQTPWANQNPSGATVNLPSVDDLHKLYLQVREAYTTNDYQKYKQYASPLRIWYLENNTKQEINYKGINAFSRVPNVPEVSFRNSLLLSVYTAPALDLLKPENVTQVTSSDSYDFYYFDPIKKEKYLVTNSKWEHQVTLNYTISPNSYQNGSGKVYFVYYQGEWKYNYEIWTSDYAANVVVGDTTTKGGATISVNPKQATEQNKVINIKAGDNIVWNNFYGIIYTISPSTDNWYTPLISNASYKKQFNQKGSYTYVVSDTFKELYQGIINVE